jgi:hypothetical protein
VNTAIFTGYGKANSERAKEVSHGHSNAILERG